jgi:hypothetical protein
VIDAQRAANEADERARGARSLLSEHTGFQAAMARLEAAYLAQFRASAPDKPGDRDAAYFLLRALDAIRQDIDAAAAGGEITRRNLRSALKQ